MWSLTMHCYTLINGHQSKYGLVVPYHLASAILLDTMLSICSQHMYDMLKFRVISSSFKIIEWILTLSRCVLGDLSYRNIELHFSGQQSPTQNKQKIACTDGKLSASLSMTSGPRVLAACNCTMEVAAGPVSTPSTLIWALCLAPHTSTAFTALFTSPVLSSCLHKNHKSG